MQKKVFRKDNSKKRAKHVNRQFTEDGVLMANTHNDIKCHRERQI